MEVELHTGKSHQIRVMLSSYGFPIAGDTKYRTEHTKKNGRNTEMDAQFLCAVKMIFPENPELKELSGAIITCRTPFSLEDFGFDKK